MSAPVPRLRIAFAGTPEFAVPALETLLASPHEVVGVITQPDRPAGRGRRLAPPPVRTAAEAAGLSVIQPERLERATLARATGGDCDLMVVVAFGQLLPADVLEWPAHGALNLHASLLPRWRGAAPIARAILAGDRETGVSAMQMTPALDAGPVLARRRCAIAADDTAATLHDRLAALGPNLLSEVLADLPGHVAAAQAQDDAAVTFAPKLRAAEAVIDWGLPAAAIERRVRAFDPWPGARTALAERALRLRRARVLASAAGAAPGVVVAAGDDGVDVATGEGMLRLLEVQPAGGRAMPASDFARGHDLVGRCLGESS